MDQVERLKSLRGLVATCVGIGGVDADFASAHEEMRVFNEKHGFTNVEYRRIPCVLVEAGRDSAASHALHQDYDFVLQIDADAAPFPPDAMVRLLQRAYIDAPDADVVGAYCQLKQWPYLPTIDTGTGTWEEHYPGEGLLPVIRTGGHFHLAKTSAYKRFPAPWYRSRQQLQPIQAFAEVDNYVRLRFDGRNPFAALPEWEQMVQTARAESKPPAVVGEDSGFCDALLAAGGRIYVDTDLVAGHVAKMHITPQMLKEAMDGIRNRRRAACGIGRAE